MYRKLGVKNPIDQGAVDLASVLQKISHQRCDFFPSPMEPIIAGKQLGLYHYSSDITALRLPWAGTTTFHAFISKTSPRAFQLYTEINHQLQILQSRGESDMIFNKWLKNGDGL
jgi:polar amino acid transport system substrate-binding protein